MASLKWVAAKIAIAEEATEVCAFWKFFCLFYVLIFIQELFDIKESLNFKLLMYMKINAFSTPSFGLIINVKFRWISFKLIYRVMLKTFILTFKIKIYFLIFFQVFLTFFKFWIFEHFPARVKFNLKVLLCKYTIV